MSGDRGSGSVIAVAFAAVALCLALGMGGVGVALAQRERVAAAADSAALAAADVARGLIPGDACDAARRVAEASGARLVSCRLDGAVATVTATASIAGLRIRATARAGPP